MFRLKSRFENVIFDAVELHFIWNPSGGASSNEWTCCVVSNHQQRYDNFVFVREYVLKNFVK